MLVWFFGGTAEVRLKEVVGSAWELEVLGSSFFGSRSC